MPAVAQEWVAALQKMPLPTNAFRIYRTEPVNLLLKNLRPTGELRGVVFLPASTDELYFFDHGRVELGAMIEVPAAVLRAPQLMREVDFVSIGTNDLIQYTLAIDRADEAVAHLYDPLHPAVLRLVADTIAQAQAAGKDVCVCGEMAGDASLTRLLLGLGLRSFSMHPAQVLSVKQEVLRADTSRLRDWAHAVMAAEEPSALMAQGTVQGAAQGMVQSMQLQKQ